MANKTASKTAVVTGVSSFVGCHLARAFTGASYDVVAVISHVRDAYDGVRAERLKFIGRSVQFVVCDLTDANAVGELIAKHKPDVWVQHAGYAVNYASLDYDLKVSLALNVGALEPLYRQLSGAHCRVIVTGSSMEYATSDTADREDDVCAPDMPYGVSKLAETTEAARLAELFDVPTRVARLYIPVGPYDAPGKLMDFVIRQLAAGEVAELSPCTQKRDFLGVDDICRAYVKLADDFARQTFDIFNVCSGEAIELKALLANVAHIIGADQGLLRFGAKPMRPGEPMVSFGSNAKARAILGWHPRPIDDALKALISHVRESR